MSKTTLIAEFEVMPRHVLLETVSLEELYGRIRMIDQPVIQSMADRDGMLRMGTEHGAAESKQRLAALRVKACFKGCQRWKKTPIQT